jgi:hypothetical protein
LKLLYSGGNILTVGVVSITNVKSITSNCFAANFTVQKIFFDFFFSCHKLQGIWQEKQEEKVKKMIFVIVKKLRVFFRHHFLIAVFFASEEF